MVGAAPGWFALYGQVEADPACLSSSRFLLLSEGSTLAAQGKATTCWHARPAKNSEVYIAGGIDG